LPLIFTRHGLSYHLRVWDSDRNLIVNWSSTLGLQKQQSIENEDDLKLIEKMSNNPLSKAMDKIFVENFNVAQLSSDNVITKNLNLVEESKPMSDKDQDLSLDLEELDIGDLSSDSGDSQAKSAEMEGLDLRLDATSDLNLDDNLGSTVSNESESGPAVGEIYPVGDPNSFELSLEEDLNEDTDLSGEDSDENLEIEEDGETNEDNDDSSELYLEEDQIEENVDEISLVENQTTEHSKAEEDPALDVLEQDFQLTSTIEQLSVEAAASDFNLEASKTDGDIASSEPTLSSGDIALNVGSDIDFTVTSAELSEDALNKLKEIDQIMVHDKTLGDHQIENFKIGDEPSIELSGIEPFDSPLLDESKIEVQSNKSPQGSPVSKSNSLLQEASKEPISQHDSKLEPKASSLREISGAYTNELEKNHATISNLRADREELLKKIQVLEDEKTFNSRQTLSIRAELDEKKIELIIIRKKLNEEILNLKDNIKVFEEKALILEERNKMLSSEVDKANQKNKIDFKRVQLRERELEQKLELLKSDAEVQIRNRDLKIIELKRKIDSMEFDMESISQQEKKSIESKFELEDKLDRAIKTLRSAINLLEDDSEKNRVAEILKKNIDV